MADRADAAVHHVGGRDHVEAGLGLDHRLGDQHRDAVVVVDVFAVLCRGSRRHGRGRCRDRARRRRPARARGIRASAGGRRGRRGCPDSAPRSPRRSSARAASSGRSPPRGCRVRRPVPHARPAGRSRPAPRRAWRRPGHLALALEDEDRPDQVVHGQGVLGDQPAGPGIPPVAPHAGIREGPGRGADAHAASRAWSRSARMSSMCSMPIDSRT